MSGGSTTAELVAQAIVRRLRPLAIVLVAAPLLASAAWGSVPDRYEARARVTVQDPQTINPFLGDLAVEW